MPLKSEKNACLFGSLFRNYLPLHPISQLKALIISVLSLFKALTRRCSGKKSLLKDSPG